MATHSWRHPSLVRQLKCCILPSVAAPLLLPLLLLLSLLLSLLLPLLPVSEAVELMGLLDSGAWRAAAMVPEAENGCAISFLA